MGGQIDNFPIVYDSLLKFDKEGELYLVLILKRRKDTKGKKMEEGDDETHLIKHYFLYDKERLQQKEAAIRRLCEQNNARAYILPQRRSHDLVMWALHNKTGDILKCGAKNTHFDHLIRSCVAGMHEVPPDAKWHKRWVIDIDNDDREVIEIAQRQQEKCGVTPDFNGIPGLVNTLVGKLKDALVRTRRELWGCSTAPEVNEFMPNVGTFSEDDITMLPTPHGFHIVTPPFNREPKAMEKYFGFAIPSSWIKPDALTLIYAPATITEGEA